MDPITFTFDRHVWLSLVLLACFLFPFANDASAHDGDDHNLTATSSRVWTFTDTGAHIHGSYMASKDGKVQVRRDDGKVVSLEITKLTKTDRQWIDRKVEEIQTINASHKKNEVLVRAIHTETIGPPKIEDTFEPFAKLKAVEYRKDNRFFYLESNGMPDHRMMVGITAWQQQVPLPQPYKGDNAWRIPLDPVVASRPMSAKTNFFRGAIALAANGVPIFNPIKNDGRTDTFLAGELDEFGGHCGRGDDYHYHIAPLHLQEVVGEDNPIAYALDGYPIFGLNETDGTATTGLDRFNGHETPELGYHYHSTNGYPYINGGFHGEVTERGGQVDPQPRTEGIRPAQSPLRDAIITDFEIQKDGNYHLEFRVRNETRKIDYQILENGTVSFRFTDGRGRVTTESYKPRPAPPGPRDKRGPGPGANRPEPPKSRSGNTPKGAASNPIPKSSGQFQLTSPAFADGDPLPRDFNGDGEGVTPPLEWQGAPKETQSYAIVMDHVDRENVTKTYWVLYDIPADVQSLSKNSKDIGKSGATWKRDQNYVPPRSAGPGAHRYTIHIYALSKTTNLGSAKEKPTREQLLEHIQDSILDTAEINVTYSRPR